MVFSIRVRLPYKTKGQSPFQTNQPSIMNDKAPGCLRLMMPLAGGSVRLQNLLHIGLACAHQVKKMGGYAKCFSAPDFIVVEISCVPRDQVEALVDGLGDSPSMTAATLKLVIEERATPEMNIESPGILPGEIASERLTKKFLTGLPDGAIVVGNGRRDGFPDFWCRLDHGQDRARIWMRAVNAGAAQRTCHVYWNSRDVLAIHGINPDEDSGEDGEDPLPNPCLR
jgi:hypothetical protein